jgi:hypothetical protein
MVARKADNLISNDNAPITAVPTLGELATWNGVADQESWMPEDVLGFP